jgi:hypothetical protein
MSKNTSSQPYFIQSQKVLILVNEYSTCVTKTANSIIELANIVYRAKEDLNNQEYEFFRKSIKADDAKDSYLKKLHCIAQKSSRLVSIKEKLPAAYTTLYALAKLTDAEFQLLLAEDAIKPNLTANELLKLKIKKSKHTPAFKATEKFSIKSSANADLYNFLIELQNLCTKFNVELNSRLKTSNFVNAEKDNQIDSNIQEVNCKSIALVA